MEESWTHREVGSLFRPRDTEKAAPAPPLSIPTQQPTPPKCPVQSRRARKRAKQRAKNGSHDVPWIEVDSETLPELPNHPSLLEEMSHDKDVIFEGFALIVFGSNRLDKHRRRVTRKLRNADKRVRHKANQAKRRDLRLLELQRDLKLMDDFRATYASRSQSSTCENNPKHRIRSKSPIRSELKRPSCNLSSSCANVHESASECINTSSCPIGSPHRDSTCLGDAHDSAVDFDSNDSLSAEPSLDHNKTPPSTGDPDAMPSLVCDDDQNFGDDGSSDTGSVLSWLGDDENETRQALVNDCDLLCGCASCSRENNDADENAMGTTPGGQDQPESMIFNYPRYIPSGGPPPAHLFLGGPPPPPAQAQPQAPAAQPAPAAAGANEDEEGDGDARQWFRVNVNFGGENPLGAPFTIPTTAKAVLQPEFQFLQRDIDEVTSILTKLAAEVTRLANVYVPYLFEEADRVAELEWNNRWTDFVDGEWQRLYTAQQAAITQGIIPQHPIQPPPPHVPSNTPQIPGEFTSEIPRIEAALRKNVPVQPFSKMPTFARPHVNFDQQFMLELLNALTCENDNVPNVPKFIPDEDLRAFVTTRFLPLRPLIPFAKSRYMALFRAQLARELSTNMKNMISINATRRIRKYLNLRAWLALQTFNGGHGATRTVFTKSMARRLGGHIWGLVYGSQQFEVPEWLDVLVADIEARQAHGHQDILERMFWEVYSIYHFALVNFGSRDLRPASIKADWESWLSIMFWIQREFDAHRNVRKVFRHFSLLPLGKVQVRMVLFDSHTLLDLLKIAHNGRNHRSLPPIDFQRIRQSLEPLVAFTHHQNSDNRDEAFNRWRRVTRFEDFETGFTPAGSNDRYRGHKFALSFRSDGLSARLHMRKRDKTGTALNLEAFLQSPADQRDLRGKRIASCDPGRDRTTYHVAVDVPSHLAEPRPLFRPSDSSRWRTHNNLGFSTDEFYFRAGYLHAEAKRAKYMKKDRNIARINKEMPTAKSVDQQTLFAHVVFFYTHLERMLAFYRQRRWRELRFRSKSGQQSALSTLVKKFCGPRKPAECLIAWGSAQFPQSSKGHRTSPNQLIRKAFLSAGVKLVLMDEFRTSRICSKCLCPFPKDSGTKQRLYSVRSCGNLLCRTIWNRDRNAARNILYLFMYANGLNTLRRPRPFRRPRN